MPLEEKVKNADEVINNDGTIMGTKTQLQVILKSGTLLTKNCEINENA